jgi:YidC/Oxa1 family membrane protein insertase
VPDAIDPPADGQPNPPQPSEGETCKIKGNRFDAELSTRGAALIHFFLRDPQYAGTDGLDLGSVTVWKSAQTPNVPDHERWRSLRTLFRGEKGRDQVKYDRFNWKLEPPSGSSCRFTYDDDDVGIVKTVSAGERPFELEVETTLTNKSESHKSHQFSIEAFAYRQNKEVRGGFMKRASPFVTELSCARGKEVTRKNKDDFKEGWFSEPLVDRYAAVSNSYFGQAIVPTAAPGDAKPECELLAEDWFTAGQRRDDDLAGAVYHARLEYPSVDLGPHDAATYKETAFFGPNSSGSGTSSTSATSRRSPRCSSACSCSSTGT